MPQPDRLWSVNIIWHHTQRVIKAKNTKHTLICGHTHANWGITQQFYCHDKLSSHTIHSYKLWPINKQSFISVHCFHSVDAGTGCRIECVKSMWISWIITAFQNRYIELFESGHTKRTDQLAKVWTCLHFTLCEVWAKFLDWLHVVYNSAVPCYVLLILLWISMVSM